MELMPAFAQVTGRFTFVDRVTAATLPALVVSIRIIVAGLRMGCP